MIFTDYYEIIRKNIRRYRRMANLSQEKIAQMVCCDKGTLYSMESGSKKAHLSLKLYCLIAEVLGITIIDLLDNNFEDRINETNKFQYNNDDDKYKNFDYNIYYEIIVDNVKKYRKLRGLSQEVLASKSCLSLDTIKNIENKRNNFSLETIGNIADALDIDIKLLFDGLEVKKYEFFN